MGRSNKIELQYFQVDVDILRDKKVRRLTRKYARGAEFYLYLLCAIYSDKGYYMPIDDQTAFDIADDMRIAEAEVDEMLNFCMSDNVGLFSREMREKQNILTSRGIQQRYVDTIRQLKRKVSIDPQYSLLDAESVGSTPENSRRCRNDSEEMAESSEEKGIYSEEMRVYSEETAIYSDKSKVKKSKVKENKVEEITSTPTSRAREGGEDPKLRSSVNTASTTPEKGCAEKAPPDAPPEGTYEYIPVAGIADFLKSSADWFEAFCMNNHLERGYVLAKIEEFGRECANRGETSKDKRDCKRHFNNWLRKNRQHHESRTTTSRSTNGDMSLDDFDRATRERVARRLASDPALTMGPNSGGPVEPF